MDDLDYLVHTSWLFFHLVTGSVLETSTGAAAAINQVDLGARGTLEKGVNIAATSSYPVAGDLA